MSEPTGDFDLDRHLVDPQEREAEFQRRCAEQGIDPWLFRLEWRKGRVDPDAGYDPRSSYFGKDVAALTMLLERPDLPHARRG